MALLDGKKPRNLDPFPCRRIDSNQDVTSFLILTLVNPRTFFGSLVAGSHHRRNSFRSMILHTSALGGIRSDIVLSK
jgi:hypothetical protein